MVPVSLYISLPYYLFALVWSVFYSCFNKTKQLFEQLFEGFGARLEDLRDLNNNPYDPYIDIF